MRKEKLKNNNQNKTFEKQKQKTIAKNNRTFSENKYEEIKDKTKYLKHRKTKQNFWKNRYLKTKNKAKCSKTEIEKWKTNQIFWKTGP